MIPKRKHCSYVYFLLLCNYISRCLQMLFLHLKFTYYMNMIIIIIQRSSLMNKIVNLTKSTCADRNYCTFHLFWSKNNLTTLI